MIDSIFTGGIVHTLVGAPAQAVAVRGGKIAAVGSDEEILALAGPGTKRYPLAGRCLIPAFNDSHCHFLQTGVVRRSLDLRGAKSVEEIVERGRRYVAETRPPEGAWVMGYGFDHNQFAAPRMPTRADADAISSRHPVLLDRVCGHVGTVNSAALAALGYDESTRFPGGELGTGPDGKLDGTLTETALDHCRARIPMPGVTETKRIIRDMSAHLNAMGIVSVQSDDLMSASLDTLMTAFAELEAENACTIRVWEEVEAPRLPQLEQFLARGLRSGDGGEHFKIGNIKLITDGSLGARTASLRAGYADDPANTGVPVYRDAELDEVVLRAHTAGMQVAFHVIGDAALAQCICAVERAQAQNSRELRHRIVHCQIGDAELYRRIARAEICADIQPPFVYTDAPLVAPLLGEARAAQSYAWKTLLELGVPLGGGSDSPVETFDPLWGIYCAVTRAEASGRYPGGWLPEQKLTAEQALRVYTQGGAYLSFEETSKGTIEPGKLADFTVLNKDILAVPPEQIPELQVEMTVIGGRVCYER